MKKLLLLPIMLVLLASFAFAITDNSTSYYKFENDLTDSGLIGGNDMGVLDGAAQYNSTNGRPNIKTYSDNNDRLGLTNTFSNAETIRCISLWIRPITLETNQAFFEIGDGVGATNILQIKERSTGKYHVFYIVGGASKHENDTTAVVTKDQWNMFTINIGDGGFEVYIDNETTPQISEANEETIMTTNFDSIRIHGDYDGGVQNANADVDNVYISGTRCDNATDLQDLWNGGAGLEVGAASGFDDTINISDALPTNNTQYVTSTIDMNASVNASYTYNSTLFLCEGNGCTPTSNLTTYDNAAGTEQTINFTMDLYDGNWSYYINVTIEDNDDGTDKNFFYLDSVDPVITWITPSGGDAVVGDLTTNITITDANLYSYYLNITYGGVLLYNTSNSSLTGLTTKDITDLFPISNYSGVMTATLKVCDGHTAQVIDMDARMDFGKSELTFDEVKIYQENKLLTKDIDYTYKGDRYSFDFETTLSVSTSAFIVSSPSFIDILHDKSTYAGHLVTSDKWIDFETDDLDNIQIDRISDNQVRVTVTKKKPTTDWSFNSIGELNCVVESKNFLSVNATYNTPNTVLAGSANTFLLNVTYNGLYYSPVPTATLYYNGTAYPVTGTGGFGVGTIDYQFSQSVTSPLIGADTILPYNWSYAVNGITYWTGNNSINVSPAYIDNCSTYNLPFVNYTIKDEVSGIPLTGSIEYIFEIENGLYTYNYNGSQDGGNHSFCLSPNWANFTTDITLQYSATGYGDRDYVADDFMVDNNTELISLYLLTSGNATEITIHVVDENDYDLSNVFIEAYRYDIATDTDLLVETEYTDSEGNTIFDLQTGSVYYSFKFYQGGELKLSTTRFKLFATTYDYVLRDDITSRLGDWLQLKDEITRTLTYSNQTQLVNFTWSTDSSLASFFCLNITFGNGTAAYGGCSSSLIDSLSYTITTRNVTYVAQGIVTTTTGYTYVLETLNIDTREGWRTFGKELGLVLSLLLFMVCGLIGLFNKNVAIIMGCVSMIVIYLFGLLPMGFGALMGILVIGVIALIVMNRRRHSL